MNKRANTKRIKLSFLVFYFYDSCDDTQFYFYFASLFWIALSNYYSWDDDFLCVLGDFFCSPEYFNYICHLIWPKEPTEYKLFRLTQNALLWAALSQPYSFTPFTFVKFTCKLHSSIPSVYLDDTFLYVWCLYKLWNVILCMLSIHI